MSCVARARRRLARSIWLAAAVALLCAATPVGDARAAEDGILARGDAAVSGFSGKRTDEKVPEDVHPLDRTFIDTDGASLRVFDLSKLGTAPRGQLSDVNPKLEIKARDVGQLFGVTIDDGLDSPFPNIYTTATSLFGLQIVAPAAGEGRDGVTALERLLSGGAEAEWMPGQFGSLENATPGSVYKIDGRSGKATLFANIRHDGRDNAGPGLGNVAFDPKTQQLFVSDLETGLIHRLTMDGAERSVFDHGEQGRSAQDLDAVAYDPAKRMDISKATFSAEDSTTWGYADERRRVFGLAVSKGRLYYAVTEGPSVWSVSIDEEGGFGEDPRIELELADSPPGTSITSVTFDGAGMMYLAQRGPPLGSYDYAAYATPAQAVVVRYRWDEKEGRWAETPEEYAIGLKPDHRSTVGGVALNYGYDKFGNIAYGRCRQTVWSTGEHLREGEDLRLVSQGGAKIVHGLQGNYKSRVRPQNEPPKESWFTDFDNRFDDPEAYGHVGAVAIYAPCEKTPDYELSPTPKVTPEVIGEEPPPDEPGLIVDKRCYAGAIGGQIRCTISVRNISDLDITEDAKIVDFTRILAGPGAGNLVPIASFFVPHPAIACAAAPTPDFWCTIPADLLFAGAEVAIDVFVDTLDLAIAGNLGFRNCAVLEHPNGYGKACAEGGTDIVVEKIGPGVCLPGVTCKFGLRIANSGFMPFDGDVLLADAMFVGGGVANAPITSINPPVVCSAGDMNQLPFTCQTHLSLAPGEEHIHWVEVIMPAPGDYWAENCFGVLDPALIPAGPLPPVLVGGGGSGNPSCVWVHVPAPKENLKISKAGVDAFGKCAKVGDDLKCKYEVTVVNEYTVAFNDILKIDETVPPGATLVDSGPVWTCAGGPPTYTCDTGAAVIIPPGGSVTMPVTVSISVPNVEALSCTVKNEVKIATPAGGSPGNLDGGDDTASATEWTWGISWEDPITHVTHVVCDPTNIKVTKTATGPATPAGNEFEVGYDVTLTNMGPDPYKGPLKLDETFGANVTGAAFSAPFSCTGSGTNYTCETPVIEMAKGDSLTMHVTARVADNGTCRLTNTAALTFPVAGSKGNGDGSDDSASATVSVPSRKCKPQTFVPLPRCPDGRLRRADGTCPCPKGTVWNYETRQCDDPRPHCYDPDRRRDDGSCCPRGTYFDDETGRCRVPPQVCPDPERRRDNGSCCPLGTVVSERTDRCIFIEQVCPPNTRWNYIRNECWPVRPVCREGERYDWRKRECVDKPVYCPRGTHYDTWKKRCVRDEGQCPEGMHYSKRRERCVSDDNTRTCPSGSHWNRRLKRCIADEETATCPDGLKPMSNGQCRCPRNKRWNPQTRSCERPDQGPAGGGQSGGQSTVPDCPDNTRLVRGKCVATDGIEPKACKKGERRVGRFCIPDRIDTGPKDCPKGQHRVGKHCVSDSNTGAGTGKDDNIKVTPKACPEGTHKLGRRCVRDRILKNKRKPEWQPQKLEIPKAEPPPKRVKPRLDKIKKFERLNDKKKLNLQTDKPNNAGKIIKKFFKNKEKANDKDKKKFVPFQFKKKDQSVN